MFLLAVLAGAFSAGLFARGIPEYAEAAARAGVNLDAITRGSFFGTNLLPVTIGNIIGGSVCVGCVYWFICLKKSGKQTRYMRKGSKK